MDQARREFRNVIRTGAVDDAEAEHGDKALELLRKVVVTTDSQRRCRQAVQHTIITNEWRADAMNRWLE